MLRSSCLLFAFWLVVAAPAVGRDIALRLIAFNDFHGHLEPPAAALLVPHPDDPARRVALAAGGAAYLAASVRALRSAPAHSVLVSAGDLTGASPLTSALFRDEPTVEVMNALGLDINALGNHEFDHGIAELLRLRDGGCDPAPRGATRSCAASAAPFAGARYALIAANVTDAAARTLVAASVVRNFDGVPVAFVGAVTRSTPGIVMPAGIRGWRFEDEATAINREVAELRRRGVRSFVAVIHEGGEAGDDFDGCTTLRGPLAAIVRRLDPEIAIVLSGHTHRAYRCVVDGRLVTQAGAHGRLLTVIDLQLDAAAGVIRRDTLRARNVPVVHRASDDPAVARAYPALAPEPGVAALVARYGQRAAPIAERRAGRIADAFARRPGPGGDHEAGRLIADAQLWATQSAERGGAQIAFTNPGGVRSDLRSRRPDGGVTYGDLFAMQPFGNALVTLTLTGAQLRALLERQWGRREAERARLLQPSRGFSYAWSAARPAGERVIADSMRLHGRRIEPEQRYRVTVNDYLAAGGDGFHVLRDGTERTGGPLDVDALTAYLEAMSRSAPLAPDPAPRIKRVD